MLLGVLIIFIVFVSLFFFGQALLNLLGVPISLEYEVWIEIIRSFVETVAVVVAGLWTYDKFIHGEKDPFPKIQHRIEHYDLKNGIIYLSFFVTVTNEGKRKLDLGKGKIYIRQVLPIPDRIKELIKETVDNGKSREIRYGNIPDLFIDSKQRLGWDTLGARDWGMSEKKSWLEPGQTREFQFDFLIEEDINVVEAISYFNEKAGWGLATLYTLE